MKVNDVLRKGEVAFRVLAMKDDICFCINCNTNFMPVWMPMSTLDEYTPDTAPMSDTNLTAKQKQVAHERYTMIAPMLAFLTDDKERNRLMNRVLGNKRGKKMSRLLTLLLLYRSGYFVGKYISLERLIADSKETYYEVLQDSSTGWHEGTNDYLPFVRYMLGIVVAAYREFVSRVDFLITRGSQSRNGYGRSSAAPQGKSQRHIS